MSKVVIIGGGFGGLNAAQALKKSPVDILLIDRANHHLFQPLLYQVATAALSPADIAAPIREILARQTNASVLLAEIEKIDKEKREVIAVRGDRFAYDFLIVAIGTRHSYFGHKDWEVFAPGLKTLNDALTIREKILLSYERAERCRDPAQALQFLKFVVVGGGPTGVEMAGAIAEIAHQSLSRNFRKINPKQTKVYLIEGEGQLLPSYPQILADRAKEDLEKMGVEVILNQRVTQVTSEGVWIGERLIDSYNIIWAAGNKASSLLKSLQVPLDRSNRVLVNQDLTIPEHPEIFVIGDAALCKDEKGDPLPGIAPVAIQQGRYVAKLISQKVSPKSRQPFHYIDKGMLATIGKAKAVGVIGRFKLSGFKAWLIWCLVHIFYLISFANRFLVMFHWFYLYLSNRRAIRLITRPIADREDPS